MKTPFCTTVSALARLKLRLLPGKVHLQTCCALILKLYKHVGLQIPVKSFSNNTCNYHYNVVELFCGISSKQGFSFSFYGMTFILHDYTCRLHCLSFLVVAYLLMSICVCVLQTNSALTFGLPTGGIHPPRGFSISHFCIWNKILTF